MPQTADFLLERLREQGAHRVFGYPGDGINGILGACGRAGGDQEFIQPRHEELGAFTCLDRLSGPAPFIFCSFSNQDLEKLPSRGRRTTAA